MTDVKGSQTIGCSVSSCKFNSMDYCGLSNIKVTPCTHINNGVPEDETLCASYKRK